MELEEHHEILEYSAPPPQPVGIYGWRKRCLYAFVLCLMAIVIINLALTVWIVRVLHFSLDGMGHLKIVPKGFKLQGEAEFLKTVYVNRVKSEEGSALFVQSKKQVDILTTDKKNKITSKLVVDNESILAKCDKFLVQDLKGTQSLLITDNKVVLGSGDVFFPGDLQFGGSVSTPLLRGPRKEPLEILSETNKVQISGWAGVSLSSDVGNITVDAADNINIASTMGSVHIKSPNIVLTGLPRADSSSLSFKSLSTTSPTRTSSPVYQVCVCDSGRIFLGLPSGDCRSSSQICSGP